jgi:hypothetical protein
VDTPDAVVRPRICVVPPAVRTAGPQAAALAGTVGIDLDPTQKATLDWTLGEDASRHWSAFEALVLQGRQNGKTVGWLLVRVLAGLLLFDEELILFSAHQGRTTAECFRRLRRIIGDNPSLGARIVKVDQSRGNESVELATGQRVQFVARSTNSGRGFTGDCVILDEAQSLTTDDLGAILPTLSTRPNPQVLYALSAGNPDSLHLGALRARALRGDDRHVAWLEWSKGEGDRADDPKTWAACNPAYPSRISHEYLERELAALGVEAFEKERLGVSHWPADDSDRWGVIGKAAWEGCYRPGVQRTLPLGLGVDASPDGRSAAIVAAWSAPDDARVQLVVVEHRIGQGIGWVAPRLWQLCEAFEVAAVCWDHGGPVSAVPLVVPDEVVEINPTVRELAQACGGLVVAVDDRLVGHDWDERLDLALGAARVRPLRDLWLWDRHSRNAEVLWGATLALAAHSNGGEYELGPDDVTVAALPRAPTQAELQLAGGIRWEPPPAPTPAPEDQRPRGQAADRQSKLYYARQQARPWSTLRVPEEEE